MKFTKIEKEIAIEALRYYRDDATHPDREGICGLKYKSPKWHIINEIIYKLGL